MQYVVTHQNILSCPDKPLQQPGIYSLISFFIDFFTQLLTHKKPEAFKDIFRLPA
jgi:hypothetical protein